LPISINIENKDIVVVGGGHRALSIVQALSSYHCHIILVATKILPEIQKYQVHVIDSEYQASHIGRAFLVYACSDDETLNERVLADANSCGILCSCIGSPVQSSFLLPKVGPSASSQDGDLPGKNANEGIADEVARKGKVYLVGFGPGDPDLLTIKGDRLLQLADVILYDDLLDASALEKYPGEKHYVGKRRDNHSKDQDQINEALYQYASQGKSVVRLKGGDPLIFGRGSEEKLYLESKGIETEIVPGITSAIGAAAYTGIPLTHRGVSSSVTFGTAHGKDSFKILESDTSVYYMGAKNIKDIAQKYLEHGYPDDFPVAIIYNATLPGQKVVKTSIKEISECQEPFKSPMVSIFGYTVNLG